MCYLLCASLHLGVQTATKTTKIINNYFDIIISPYILYNVIRITFNVVYLVKAYHSWRIKLVGMGYDF